MIDIDNTQIFNELQNGTVLCGGKYSILSKIGEGGFGITYKAIQQGLGRVVCIKEYFPSGKCIRNTRARTVCLQGISEDVYNKYRDAFAKEARLLASFNHRSIVDVIDVFDENNTSYMVMSYIEGRSLQSIVDKHGKLSYPEAVNYIGQITDAVSYIHKQNILHRDIKPDNIMITADNKAIIIDFGSARTFEHDKTQVHTSMLTHGYAPTEQYTANSRKGSYTDIYAIGATLYFVLTGQAPLEAAARLTEKMVEPKTHSPELPNEVNRTILKAMQLKSENRHQSILEFMDDLCNKKPSTLVDETVGGTTVNNKFIAPIILSAVVIIGALVAYLVLRPEKIVDKSNVEFATKDFTGMNIYPMIKVHGGTFLMGSNDIGEDDCPPHNVTVSDFYIGQFEVSQGLWKAIMGYNPSECQRRNNYKGEPYTQAQCDSLPVENVSYGEVQAFISELNSKTGQRFSLPSEAQWEYAARGGNKSKGYKYSGTPNPKNIWYDQEQPIKIKFPDALNELGIYQMSGNVSEWCMDYYDSKYYTKTNGASNPVNTGKAEYRVIRGGNFYTSDTDELSVFYRDADNGKSEAVGFRLIIK